MMYSPPHHVEIRLRPSYEEIADPKISARYQAAERDLAVSREGSEYVRKKIAEIEIQTKLNKLCSLRNDWDSYDSERPSRQAIETASRLAKAFIQDGLIPDAVTPSPEGGVAICFLRQDRYADVECLNSGKILAVRYSSNDDPQAWTIETNGDAVDASVKGLSAYFSA